MNSAFRPSSVGKICLSIEAFGVDTSILATMLTQGWHDDRNLLSWLYTRRLAEGAVRGKNDRRAWTHEWLLFQECSQGREARRSIPSDSVARLRQGWNEDTASRVYSWIRSQI